MRPFAVALIVFAAASATAHHGDTMLTYVEASGHFRLGLAVVGVGAPDDGEPVPAVGVGPVNLARFTFAAHVCHPDLQVLFDARPENATVSTDGLYAEFPFTFQVEIFDVAADERLVVIPFSGSGAGGFGLGRELSDGRTLRADLYMTRGVEADWDLRIRGWPSPSLPCAMTPVVNEVEANPPGRDAGAEWVELYNPNLVSFDVSGWTVVATHGTPASLTLPAGTVLAPEGRLVVAFTAGQALDNEDEVVELRDAGGAVQDATPPLSDTADDARTNQRVPDGTWGAWDFRAGTEGVSNG